MEAELASEATIVELQARIQELEQLHEADKAELQALRQSEEQANVQLQDVKEENEKLKEQTKEAKEAAHDATKSKDSVDAEKRQLLDALARADSDKQDLETSLSELRSAHQSTQASLRSIEAAYSTSAENERHLKLRLQAVEGELLIVKKDRDWNHEELQRITDESGRDRKEKNAQISRLQAQLDAAVQSSESSTTTLQALRSSHTSLEGRLTEALTKVATLTSELADSEASFRAEIASYSRLTEVLESREEETQRRLEEVEREWTAAKEDMDRVRSTHEEALAKERHRGDVLEERVREMRDFADRLAAQGTPGGALTIGEDDVFGSVAGSPLPRSPSASALALKLQKTGGKSYTEIYSSYIQMQEALNLERAESKRLSECLNEILAEIQDRAPLLREQRAEYERTLVENSELATALSKALEEKDDHIRSVDTLRMQLEEKTREVTIYTQQLEDTSRQVRVLARRVAVLEDPTIVDRSEEQTPGNTNGDLETADDYISSNLVTFTSIDQLQQQNQKLLKIARELGKKMEAEEAALRERIGMVENDAVEEAHELILRLKEEVESQRATVGAYQRERDMLRQVLKSRGTNGVTSGDGEEDDAGPVGRPGASAVSSAAADEIQRNFDAYKKEMLIDNQSIREDLAQARREVSQLQVEVARATAQKELMEERFKTANDTTSMQSKEIADLTKRNMQMQSTMARQDEATRRVTEEILDLRSTLDRTKHESMMLKAEKEVWKNVEARLTEDNASLAKERTHLSDLMRNLQAMHNDLEKNASDARKRLEEHVARMSSELESAKARLALETENARQLSLRKELEGKEMQERIDKLTSEYHEAREALLGAKNAASRSEERAEAMARQVAAYEEKLAVYEGRRNQAGGDSSLSREQQLESQIADLRAELSNAKMEAEQARVHIEQYKAIATAHEEALAELNGTYDEYKRTMESNVAQKESEIASLQERISVFTADLSSTSEENSNLHRQLEEQRSQFQREQQANLDTISNLRQIEAQVDSFKANAKLELDEQVKRAAFAHERYQSELMAHAEDVKILTAIREELAAAQLALNEAQLSAQTSQSNMTAAQESWNGQKETMQKELDEQKKRYQELTEQNDVLHAHLEKVSSQAARLQPSTAATTEAEEGEDLPAPSSDAKSVEELHAVIRYVRREKDVAELRLEMSRQQELRLRQQLESANKQLDEKSAELSEQRQRASDSVTSAVQHSELLEKIRSLNLLRESNETLRRENEKHLQKVNNLEQKLHEAEAQISPLREQVKVLQAEVEARERNVKMLEEDNTRWKNRTQQILQKYERIDPAELAQLKEELEKVKGALEVAQKEKDSVTSRLTAMETDLNDANTRAEASQTRFKQLQKVAREHRDNHNAAQAESEAKKVAMQAEIDQLTNSVKELEERINAQQATSASADAEASKKAEAERQQLSEQVEAEKAELEKVKTELEKAKEELEAAKKKHEDDLAVQVKRNTLLLNDNKKFRAQVLEAQKNTAETVEAEVQKRIAALPAPTASADGTTAIAGDNEEAVKAKLAELEERLTKERDEAIQKAVSETVTRLQGEFDQERAKLAAATASGETTSASAGTGLDEAEIQKRVDEAAQAKIEVAVKAKEEEFSKSKATEIEQAKKQVEQTMQSRIQQIVKNNQQAIQKLQTEHNEKLTKAVEEAKASAAAPTAGAGEVSGTSSENIDKAVKAALEKQEAQHKEALAKKVSEAETKAKQEFDLKGKLRESQIAALRKESAALKAKLAEATGGAAGPAGGKTAPSPVPAQVSAFLPAKPGQQQGSAAASTAAPATPKGLSIAGRSQSSPAAGGAGRGAGLSIAGSATPGGADSSATDGSPAGAGRGRGRGRGRGAPAGRGRGAIVSSALNAAADANTKRAREEEGGADSEAKRRKDGEP